MYYVSITVQALMYIYTRIPGTRTSPFLELDLKMTSYNYCLLYFNYTRIQNYATFHENSLCSNVDIQMKINSKPAQKKSISGMTFKFETQQYKSFVIRFIKLQIKRTCARLVDYRVYSGPWLER